MLGPPNAGATSAIGRCKMRFQPGRINWAGYEEFNSPQTLFLRRPLDDDLILIRRLHREIDRLRLFLGQVEVSRCLLHIGCANHHLMMAGRELQIQGRWPHKLPVDPCLGMIRHGVHSNLRRIRPGMALKKLPVGLRCRFGVSPRNAGEFNAAPEPAFGVVSGSPRFGAGGLTAAVTPAEIPLAAPYSTTACPCIATAPAKMKMNRTTQ